MSRGEEAKRLYENLEVLLVAVEDKPTAQAALERVVDSIITGSTNNENSHPAIAVTAGAIQFRRTYYN